MDKRNALIAGASGLVGNNLLNQLLADSDYDKILILVRKPLAINHNKLIQLQVDFEKIESLDAGLPIDDVFCALGTTIKTAGSQEAFFKVDFTYVVNLGKWCSSNSIRRFMVVSAMGANATSGIFYNRVKGKMEAAVSQLDIEQVHFFRPSLLMGKRNENRKGEKAAQFIMHILGFLFIGPLIKYRGIHSDKVASAMIAATKLGGKGFVVHDSGEMQGKGR